jgi:glycosyltransferase involved in cell wall biosynthesis
VTSPESVNPAAVATFYKYLSWVKEADTVAAISAAAGIEFTGFTAMVGALDQPGPSVVEVALPTEGEDATDAELAAAAKVLGVTALPLVLVVGSHEPRKNHLAVLQAAEILWKAGHGFTLAFVGGQAWRSEGFDRRVAELKAAGRPVDVHRSLDDRLLWAAYRLARFTVFPSLNEGFGLPVGESLAVGTPCITSNFGSMAEIAAQGGALLVDPRDDAEMATAIARLLDDEPFVAELRNQAAGRSRRTWNDYADDLWNTLLA